MFNQPSTATVTKVDHHTYLQNIKQKRQDVITLRNELI